MAKNNKTIFKEYLNDILRSVPEDANDTFFDIQVKTICNLARKAYSQPDEDVPDVPQEVIDEVYKAYPTKCVIRGASSGKSKNNKEKIKTLLKDYTKGHLIKTIDRYVEECKRDNVYMKNFSTFLNNLPDYNFEEEKTTPITNYDAGYRDFRKITQAQ